MATLEELQGKVTESIDVIESCREALEAAAEEVPKICLPLSGGELTGNLKIRKAGPMLKEYLEDVEYDQLPEETKLGGMMIADKNGVGIGQFLTQLWANGNRALTMRLFRHGASTMAGGCEELNLIAAPDGHFYVAGPHPQANDYGRQLATMKTLKDMTLQKLTYETSFWHVGGANASDTANLHEGRGSLAMPFATLDACVDYLAANTSDVSHILRIILHSDQTLPKDYVIKAAQSRWLQITSDDTLRTITVDNLQIEGGLQFMNVKLQAAAGASTFILVNGAVRPAILYFYEDVQMSGTVTSATLAARYGGQITVAHELTGTVTGPRYRCSNGGRIFVAPGTSIPGSAEGVCDSSSTYATMTI